MGFMGFTIWFIGGLIIGTTSHILFDNAFLTGFITALVTGVLGAKE